MRKENAEKFKEGFRLVEEHGSSNENANGLVSIIIPVYNREKIVLNTIKSVRMQTYKNLEYLVIDDGSTDRTYEVCARMMADDPRGRLLYKSNGGVSSARNIGIENAKGQYIFFLDSDDILKPDIIERLVNIIQKYNCLVIQGSCKIVSEYPQDEIVDMMYYEYFCSQLHEPVVWGKLYTRDTIGNSRFDENLPVREDVDFLYRIMKKAKKIVVLNSSLIILGKQAEHLSRLEKYQSELLDIKVSERAIELFDKEENREFRNKIWNEYFNALIRGYVYCTDKRKEIQKKFRREVLKFWKINRTSFKDRFFLILGWISLDIYELKL